MGGDVRIEMEGKKAGKLTVLGYAYTKDKRACWNCLCDCGNQIVVMGKTLRQGKTQSCGCLQAERARLANTTHGMSKQRPHRIWQAMLNRTRNKNDSHWKYYGGKGIKVCTDWLDFSVFYKWALSNGYKDNLTIERRDNSLGYCPENCTWIPHSEQSKNRTNVKKLYVN